MFKMCRWTVSSKAHEAHYGEQPVLTAQPHAAAHRAMAFASGETFSSETFFSGHCASTSMVLVIMPRMPTSASLLSYTLERCAVCTTRKPCFIMFSAVVFRLFCLPSSPQTSRSFLAWMSMPKQLDKQNHAKPSWMVPVPARLPPRRTFICLSHPMWSMIMKVAKVTFWSKSKPRSTRTSKLMSNLAGTFAGRLCRMAWITGTSLQKRCARLVLASCFMMFPAISLIQYNREPAFMFPICVRPKIARAAYCQNRASLSRPSALPHSALKLATVRCAGEAMAAESSGRAPCQPANA
mmetsp:Transcript_81310/g.188885  ORF Transcript_81310/g.188885 Transcript_81310/m.188885 type:complete len:295 (-) Transcript_81310:14-898(-)